MTAERITDIEVAANCLRDGGLVAFATETVYGLGANALDVDAVAKVFAAKQRPHFDPLIVHISKVSELSRVTTSIPSPAQLLMDTFWPGPLTLVLPRSSAVPDLVTSGLPTVAVRLPDHHIARDLIAAAGVPIAAPSANPFGRISPTTAQHVLDYLGEEIDYVLDGGACSIGVESTVVAFDEHTPRILRPGGVTFEQLQSILPEMTISTSSSDPGKAQTSPGQLDQHYAPRTPLIIVDDLQQVPCHSRHGAMALTSLRLAHQQLENESHGGKFGAVEILSENGDLTDATANFFSALRRLDAADIDCIYAEPFPETGLGRALNDRLMRAASKK